MQVHCADVATQNVSCPVVIWLQLLHGFLSLTVQACMICAGVTTLQQKLELALQLVKGVKQLHSIKMLHLYIKPHNVLVDHHSDVVLSDLGLAHQMHTLSEYIPSSPGLTGTANFM